MSKTIITSKTQLVNKTNQHVFNFLSDFNNFKNLLPEDKIENWSSTETSCSFNIKGLTSLALTIKDKKEFSQVIYKTEGASKFHFDLTISINDLMNQTCNCQIVMESDLNPMLKMLAEKPLTNLVNLMVEKLESTNF